MSKVGNNVVAATPANLRLNFRLMVRVPVAAPFGGTIDGVDLYCAGGGSAGSGTATWKGVVYADSAGAPGALLGTGAEVSVPFAQAAGWVTSAIASPIAIAPGTAFVWIGWIGGPTDNVARYFFTTGASGSNVFIADTYSDGAANPSGAPTNSTQTISVRANLLPTADTGMTVTSGLKLWVDAYGVGQYADAAAVPTLDNLASGGPAIVATAVNPIYKTGILNSKGVVRTNGTSSGYVVAGTVADLFGLSGQRTMIFVGRVASVATAANDFENPAVFGDVDDGVGMFLQNDSSVYTLEAYNYVTALDPAVFAVAPDAFSLNTGVMLEDTSDATTLKARVNGGTAGAAPTAAPDGMASVMRIAFKSGTGNYPGLDIAELLIYNRALSDVERRTVEAYLVAKWLPGVTLPAAGGAGESVPLLGVG